MKENREPSKQQLTKHYGTDEDQLKKESDDDALFDHYTLVASKGQRPLRVDKFLSNLLPFTTRSKIKNASRTGSISVNGKEVKLSYKVKADDKVKIMLPYPPAPKLEAEEMDLDIRYEDDELIVLHKPPGMVCHPSIGHHSGTLVHGLLWHIQHLPSAKGDIDEVRPGLVHRLDRDTSGIMVVAKSEYAMSHLAKQFFDRSTGRTYQAVVWGDVAEDSGTIFGHVGRHPKERKLYFTYPNGEAGKHAVTHYRVIERYGVATLVECKLETGRTHQIRVHMKYIGHTLFMDKEYGGDKILKGNPTQKYKQFIQNGMKILPRQALHAKTLDFTHPTSGERLSFDSDLPDDMAGLIDKLKKWAAHQG
ncbi:MAG: RluA family pseudouridine synthase [Bacteroidia bacterium]|nr:RluA family pseudouridine synthase [Bacteroidia bacterium]